MDIVNIDDFKGQLIDYQLIILYQPNNKFNTIVDFVQQNNTNYLVVAGANTDWNFINKKQLGFTKNAIWRSNYFKRTSNIVVSKY